MEKRPLGNSDLRIAPLVLGGNVFGWTIDEASSFKILDCFVDGGFNLIDTANVYSRWASGNKGGESETIIGRWIKKSGKRHQVLLATKVGMDMGEGRKGLKKNYIIEAVEESLQRLQTEVIDLYQSHLDDLSTSPLETLEGFEKLKKDGKVRFVGASQISPQRLEDSLKVSFENQIAKYTCLQPLYNLYDRQSFEENYAEICKKNNLGVITYYSLASGFLTGKYRKEADLKSGARAAKVASQYFNEKGLKILKALDTVSKKLNRPVTTVSLAWILSNPLVTAPIASATTVDQLAEIMDSVDLKLDNESLMQLDS
jgi:aryl-alcohol dehydrogenase-like predicted oxidoreductase